VQRHPAKARARAVARRQHSAIALRQLERAGLSRQQIRTMVGTGELVRVCAKVFVIAASPDTWLQRAVVATLAHERLWLSHRAAAHLHGFDGFSEPPMIEVVGPRGGRPSLPPDVLRHTSDLLHRSDLCRTHSIPATNAAATLCQLPAVVKTRRVAQAVDHLLRSGASPLWIRRTAERWACSRLRGPEVVLALLAERVGRRLPRSWFERLAKAAFDNAGIALEHEYPVVHDGRIVASLDLAQPELRVGVECQSWERHGAPSAAYHDTRRKRLLRRLGWQVVEVWWWDLERMCEAVDEVVAALDVAKKRLDSSRFFAT
jgi:hypothetical protein